MENVLQTNGLRKKYGKQEALAGLTMTVPRGAIFGLVGKNGAGKTTLMRILCGLQSPTAGEYRLFDIPGSHRSIHEARRRMGAVVETPAIYPNMTAEQNLRHQYRILGLPSEDGLQELLKLVGLDTAGKKKTKHFSLGMRQRLGIAMALCGGPDFLVLDEPVNGLDPQGIIEIRELILHLNREQGITILISSHILDELSRLATHYGFIDRGRLIKEMSAGELNDACRKSLRARVTDTKALARVLDEQQVEYKILSETEAQIFATLNVSQLALGLAKEQCEVFSLQEQDESLESFYLNLLGGDEQ